MFRINAGVHWRGSVQQHPTYYGYADDNARRAPVAADASCPHRPAVGIDAALLGPGSSLTPGSCGSLAISPRFVSFLLVLPVLIRQLDRVFAFSVPPAWKQLINDSLSTHERISLITSIFSGDNEVEAVVHLSGEDAQNFVDVVYEVGLYMCFPPKDGLIASN